MKLIGIDIGGTKCAVILGEENGSLTILKKSVFETKACSGPYSVLEKLAGLVAEFQAADPISGIGISCGGPLNSAGGVILSPPNLPGWDNIPVTEYFSSRFWVPCYLQNDANACALAEWRHGVGKGLDSMIFLTFGTGLGAGLILNGALYTGKQDMAGEAGHWRMENYGPAGYGKAGSLEGFCSGGGIAQLGELKLRELIQAGKSHPLAEHVGAISAKMIFELADQGDGLCLDICTVVGEQFGRGLAMMIDLLNPEAVVAGSIFTRNYSLLCPIVERVVQREALQLAAASCKILPSALGEGIGDMAALTVAAGGY